MVLKKAENPSVRFNKKKCQICVKEVKYIDHILTNEGIKSGAREVEAIKRIPIPRNTKELSRF